MKRTSLLVALSLGITFTAASARADDAPARGREVFSVATVPDATSSAKKEHATTLHIDPVMLVPLGSLGNSTGVGIGGLVGFEYEVSHTLGFTGRAGYISGLTRRTDIGEMTITSSMGELPVLAGLTYYPSENHRGAFVAAEAGPIMVSSTTQLRGAPASIGDVTSSAGSIYLGGVVSAGYRVRALDFRAGLFVIDATHVSQSAALLASLTYSFVEL